VIRVARSAVIRVARSAVIRDRARFVLPRFQPGQPT
jgi:hypothetical protein